ncbi:MAG: HAMP domain-containing protein [Acidobacteria bacterium]|nr:HAMP domain-containing protein [Acidobacteriaceae bacterium]MBV9608774.1 HAMP domain-containing protein [Acidobacteriota bacterium]
MRSLFFKIFLSFWLTVVLIGLAVYVTWIIQPEVVVSRWRSVTGEALDFYAQSAVEIADRQGPGALTEYFNRLERNTHIHAALLDDSGALVAGSASSRARDVGMRSVGSGKPELDLSRLTGVGAHPSVGPSGRKYVLVAEMSRSPFLPFRPGPGKQLLRVLLAVLISGSLCYALTTYLTRPVLHLRTAARQLSEGDLSARASQQMERRRDEIGDLVRDFNRMADRIESLVTAQRQLISDISHELRSPLARLNVALGLARQRASADVEPNLDRIEREAERLNEMIGQLLTLARLDDHTSPPGKEEVELPAVLQEVAADAEFEAAARNCTVRLTGLQPCVVHGTPELLRSAIENVVRNAIRYTAEGTEVNISLKCEPDGNGNEWAVIAVRDFGPGVPDAELPKLFRPFYRVADARERQSGGVGLGLAITERALRIHGGSVQAKNASNGGLLVEMRLAMNGARPKTRLV